MDVRENDKRCSLASERKEGKKAAKPLPTRTILPGSVEVEREPEEKAGSGARSNRDSFRHGVIQGASVPAGSGIGALGHVVRSRAIGLIMPVAGAGGDDATAMGKKAIHPDSKEFPAVLRGNTR